MTTETYVAECDTNELACRILEAQIGLIRPEGLTAEQCLARVPEKHRNGLKRAAFVAFKYACEALNSAQRQQ